MKRPAKRNLRIVREDEPTEEPVSRDELTPHSVPKYSPWIPFPDNIRMLIKPMWGRARADWGWCLAEEVVERFPDAETEDAPAWAAGVLCAAAVEVRALRDPALWEHILDDITRMTGVDRATVIDRWADLQAAGMLTPKNPPEYWYDAPDQE